MFENCFENQKFVWQVPENYIYQNSEYEVAQKTPVAKISAF
jgi:hypothetical protein